jgi:hypothetical protein
VVLQADRTTQIDGFKKPTESGVASSKHHEAMMNDDAGVDVSFEGSCVRAIAATGKIVRAPATIPPLLGGHAVEQRTLRRAMPWRCGFEHLATQALALREGRTSFSSQVRSPRRNTAS